MITVVNSGLANISSVTNALHRLQVPYCLSTKPDEIYAASHIIFPGVGAAADAMSRLHKMELVECLQKTQSPLLGICLGMGLLFTRSDEGDTACLDILSGSMAKFKLAKNYTVPHMGWNTVTVKNRASLLMRDIPEESYFYFVHSYYAPLGKWVVASCDYGGEFTAVLEQDNFFGTQFHPERSSLAGARLLKNFVKL